MTCFSAPYHSYQNDHHGGQHRYGDDVRLSGIIVGFVLDVDISHFYFFRGKGGVDVLGRERVNLLLETGLTVLENRVGRIEKEPGYALFVKLQHQQILLNLTLNAVEAIPDSGRIYITTSSGSGSPNTPLAGKPCIYLKVKDNGHGVDPQVADKIFEPFFTTKSDGMGLGLSISRSIVEAHAGRLWAAPNPDRGMTFHLTLPAKSQT